MIRIHALIALMTLSLVCSCASYEYKPVPFKSAESYSNHATVFGAVIAAHAWTDRAQAKNAFGFDIRGAGITPVQIVVDNKGPNTLHLIPDQTLIKDSEGNFWNILPADVAYQRIDKQLTPERMGTTAAKKGGLGAVAGGILGAAFGVVTGTDVGTAAAKGAVAGGALGTVMGGYEGLDDPRSKQQISSDLQNRNLRDQPLKAHEISHGFLFFPGEIQQAQILRVKLRNASSKQIEIVELPIR